MSTSDLVELFRDEKPTVTGLPEQCQFLQDAGSCVQFCLLPEILGHLFSNVNFLLKSRQTKRSVNYNLKWFTEAEVVSIERQKSLDSLLTFDPHFLSFRFFN